MHVFLITQGFQAPNAALTLNRVALYVPEALYRIGLTVVMLAGSGPLSLDAAIA